MQRIPVAGPVVTLLLLVVAPGACARAALPAPAPQAGADVAAARVRHTRSDVDFVRAMIGHHAQAVRMAAAVPGRTDNRALHLLAERIGVSQEDEIAMMRAWLEARGAGADDSTSAHMRLGAGHSAAPWPGMLGAEEVARLEGARGAPFDRLFLTSMIRHHEGALAMVAALLATPGAAQDPQLSDFVTEVDADQRAEIARMRALLRTLP